MKKITMISLAFGLVLLLIVPMALAQSSGNFAAEVNNTSCSLSTTDGLLTGGIPLANFPWKTKIKVPNGSGTSLIIRPSFVTGIYTKTRLETGLNEDTAYAGIKVCVDLDEGKINGSEAPVCIYYDKRFQQLKSNLFTTLLQDCDPVTEGIQPCYLEFVLSTLGAHSFDFVGHDIPNGEREITVTVLFADDSGDNAAACIGPGTVTVTQTKIFSSSDGIDLSTP